MSEHAVSRQSHKPNTAHSTPDTLTLWPVLHLIVPHCSLDTVFVLLQTSRFLRKEAVKAVGQRGGEFITIKDVAGSPSFEAWDYSLPWFHPDGSMELKKASLNKCRVLNVDFPVLQNVQHLLAHLPRNCDVNVCSFPLGSPIVRSLGSPAWIVLPPVNRLRFQLDTEYYCDLAAGVPALSTTHNASHWNSTSRALSPRTGRFFPHSWDQQPGACTYSAMAIPGWRSRTRRKRSSSARRSRRSISTRCSLASSTDLGVRAYAPEGKCGRRCSACSGRPTCGTLGETVLPAEGSARYLEPLRFESARCRFRAFR